MKPGLLVVLACIIAICLVAPAFGQTGGYHVVDSLVLGGDTGWDYLIVDTTAHRVYVSRGTHVQVVDIDKLAVVGDIAPTPGVHGIALAQSFGRGYISNGRDSSVTVFDLKTLQVISTIHIDARNPDAIMYDPISHRVFTFNGGSGTSTAIDAATNAVVGTVPLDGKPEFAVEDGGRIFANIEDKSEIVAFNASTLKVIYRNSIAPGEEPSGLAIDRAHHELFSVCGNKMMMVLDEITGKVLAHVPIGGGVDAAAFDPRTGLAFSSNGEGNLTVVKTDGGTSYSVLETVPTRRGARTVALDETTHRLYTVTAKFGPPPASTAERPRPRPTIVPGSVALYVIGR